MDQFVATVAEHSLEDLVDAVTIVNKVKAPASSRSPRENVNCVDLINV